MSVLRAGQRGRIHEHQEDAGRDAVASAGWDDHGPGRPPRETPLPDDPPGAATNR